MTLQGSRGTGADALAVHAVEAPATGEAAHPAMVVVPGEVHADLATGGKTRIAGAAPGGVVAACRTKRRKER